MKKNKNLILKILYWFYGHLSSVKSRLLNEDMGVYPIIFHDIPQLSKNRFQDLLEILIEKHTFITPDNFELYMNGEYFLKEDQLLLTFDDGYYSNYLIAKEILDKYKIKAIFFISTGFIDLKNKTEINTYIKKNFFDNVLPTKLDTSEMKPMSWRNLEEIIELGHTIGSHTKNHNYLSSILDNDLLKEEIVLSGKELERNLGIKVEHFAFPFGNLNSMSSNSIRIAEKKYKYIHTGIRGKNLFSTSTLAIRRESMNILDDFDYNQFIANGGLSFYYWKDRQKLNKMVQKV